AAFFFQAEDGIRDFHVTGVQTCALPILAKMTGGRAKALTQRVGRTLADGPAIAERAQIVTADGMTSRELAQRLAQDTDVEYAVRSEERRVGKGPSTATRRQRSRYNQRWS